MIRKIDHTADAGFEITAPTQKELFVEAAYAMLDILYDRTTVDEEKSRTIKISASEVDILLHDFLSEILQIAQYELFLVSRISLKEIDDRHIEAEIFGEKYNPEKHEFFSEIKAITYHQLTAEPRGKNWFGRVIVDI
ncbi:archease [bacterium]|nr:archease [bacterium]